MGKRYAEVIETIWFTFLYASLLPLGPFVSFIGIGMLYWIDKYNLLRRSKLSNNIGSKLPLNAVILLEMILIWKPIGDLIFDLQIRDGQLVPSTIVMIVLGVIYVLLPKKDAILKFFFYEKFNIKYEKYSKVQNTFDVNYRSLHPYWKYY